MAYVFGKDNANESLGTDIPVDSVEMENSIYKNIAGETWVQRLNELETKEELERLAFTESHRNFSDGQYNTAVKGGATHKEWVTMGDDKVRDSHWYLEGLKVPIDENFYTLDGDFAPHPFGFMSAENNINCRCTLKYTKE